MKPLFSEEEFDKAKTNDKLSCECEQCGNAFFKPKKDIQRVLRGHNVEWCKYCSNNCKYIAYGYRKYRIGKETGYKCKQCDKPAIYYSYETTGDFCSKQCAAIYSSNVNSKQKINSLKKTYNDKFLNHEYKKHYCERCDNYIGKSSSKKQFKKTICDNCSEKRIKNQTLFEKLNTIDLNQTYEYNVKLAFDILKNDYEINQMSIPEINKKYNIVHPEVLRFFQECKFKLRNTAEGVSLYMIKNNFNASKNNYACGYHTAWTGNVFWLRSSYEEKLANKLDEIREYYEYENIRIPYIFNNEIKYYIPDFILPQRNLILETKSDYFFKIKKDKIKLQYNAGKNTGYKIDFLFQKDIKKLNEVKSFDDILSFFTNRIYF